MYNEEKLYSARSVVVVHILNVQREMAETCRQPNKTDTKTVVLSNFLVESSQYVPQLMILY